MARFAVHGTDEPQTRSRLVEDKTFEAAALQFAEDHHGDGEIVSVIVEDCESGERQCFRIDLDSGEAGPCA